MRQWAFKIAILLSLAAPAAAQELVIEMRLGADGRLLLDYLPPAGVTELQLWDRKPAAERVWREMVQPLDDCGSLLSGQRIRLSAACSRARFAVKPQVLNLNAVYEPAIPVGSEGLLAYTSFYAATVPGFGLRWRWLAPEQGYVLHQGRRSEGDAVEQAASAGQVAMVRALGDRDGSVWPVLGASQYVYLGRGPLDSLPGSVLVRDPALDAGRLDKIRDTLSASVRLLSEVYGVMPSGPGAVVVATADLSNYKGDTDSVRSMLLRLTRQPERMSMFQLQWFVAHEVTHWWNAGVYRSDPDHPWLHEGHADWMAMLVLHRLGYVSEAMAKDRLEWELNQCVRLRGGRTLQSLPAGRDGGTYSCGMVLMMAGQLARSAHAPKSAPLDTLASLHRGRTALLTQADFATWADGPAPAAMHRLLFDGALGFDKGLRALLGSRAAVEVAGEDAGEALPAWAAEPASTRLMSALMKNDCGNDDFWSLKEGFRMGELKNLRCRNLRPGQLIDRLEGVRLRSQPALAWAAMRRACATGSTLRLQDATGGEVQLDCPRPLPEFPAQTRWTLNPEALQALGLNS